MVVLSVFVGAVDSVVVAVVVVVVVSVFVVEVVVVVVVVVVSVVVDDSVVVVVIVTVYGTDTTDVTTEGTKLGYPGRRGLLTLSGDDVTDELATPG